MAYSRRKNYSKSNIRYGRIFTKKINGRNRKVMYRYIAGDKSTKHLVDAETKAPL